MQVYQIYTKRMHLFSMCQALLVQEFFWRNWYMGDVFGIHYYIWSSPYIFSQIIPKDNYLISLNLTMYIQFGLWIYIYTFWIEAWKQ
jgi:hypothetical protein